MTTAAEQTTEDIPRTHFSDVIAELTPDKDCKKPGCYGRGYYGAKLNTDGTKEILFCSCAKFRDTGYVMLAKRLRAHHEEVEQTMQAILENQVALHGFTRKKFHEAAEAKWSTRFLRLFQKKPLELRSANDIPDLKYGSYGESLRAPSAPVPVIGDVQAGEPLTKP